MAPIDVYVLSEDDYADLDGDNDNEFLSDCLNDSEFLMPSGASVQSTSTITNYSLGFMVEARQSYLN